MEIPNKMFVFTDYKKLEKIMVSVKMGPGPRFEPESWDPQSQRITTYPTPANELNNGGLMREQGFEPW